MSKKNKRSINVLSCFDGLGSAMFALRDAGISVDTYFYSEIDKYAVSLSSKLDKWCKPTALGNDYTGFINVGDIRTVYYKNGKLYSEKIPYGIKCKIDLVIGGFPCQKFSRCGSQQGFEDNDLVFIFTELIKETKANYFIGENTLMKKCYEDKISENFGVLPIKIDAKYFSAQSRIRNYWTNIPNVCNAKLQRIQSPVGDLLIKHILEDNFKIPKKYYLSSKIQNRLHIYRENSYKNGPFGTTIGHECSRHGQRDAVYGENQKMGCLTATDYKQPKQIAIRLNLGLRKFLAETYKIFPPIQEPNYIVRKLTPLECERLQGIDEYFTKIGFFNGKFRKLSDSQRYRLIGNGFSIPVITQLLKYMKDDLVLNNYNKKSIIKKLFKIFRK